jgi:hypothetical protein
MTDTTEIALVERAQPPAVMPPAIRAGSRPQPGACRCPAEAGQAVLGGAAVILLRLAATSLLLGALAAGTALLVSPR